jgi:hypothetical protein
VFLRPCYDLAARPSFLALPEPTDVEVATLLDRIIDRVMALLRRHGRVDDEVIDPEPEQPLLFAARSRVNRGEAVMEDEPPPLCARRDGFSLHAASAVHGNDRAGLERLCAYALGPPLAQGRLSLTDDGQVRYIMKRTFSDGTRALQFTPRELVARLCALVPPPRFHQVRYSGIFAGHARGRYALTGRGLHDAQPATPPRAATATRVDGEASPPPGPAGAPVAGSSDPAVDQRDPGAPGDPGRARRLAWSDLMRRAHTCDVLVCPQCGGEMRLIAVIQEPAVCEKILRRLGLWQRGPPRGRRVVPDPPSPERLAASTSRAADLYPAHAPASGRPRQVRPSS